MKSMIGLGRERGIERGRVRDRRERERGRKGEKGPCHVHHLPSFSASGPTDVHLSGVNTNILTVEGLHIDESVGSPTLYEFMLTVVDYANLTDNDTVFVVYRKGDTLSTARTVCTLCTFCVTQLKMSFPSHCFILSLPVHTDPQTPPIASAGPPITITLPQDTVSLDGSKSADDFGIKSYLWVRSRNSPAAGVCE